MPTETIGRYEVEGIIGRGAMAVVFKAIDPTIGRTVALKTMRFDVSGIDQSEVLARFRNEARAAGKLLHTNLVTIYDAGEQGGTFYIAMECVEGSTLQAVLYEHRFLPFDRIVEIMSQICSGLDYAHANGVVHRDIKPANIMMTKSGVIKIMDFGIAKSGAQLNTGGNVLGTPNYISPEMVKGDHVDGRSDLFSAAVILHEMLLGERPFLAPNISTIIYKIVNEPLSADLETRVHPAMAGILRKALSKHPSDRYQTGADLVNALKSYQALLAEPTTSAVFPGTPIAPAWSNSGAAAAPKLAEKAPMPPPLPRNNAAPEVFGTDVPDEFRSAVPAPVPASAGRAPARSPIQIQAKTDYTPKPQPPPLPPPRQSNVGRVLRIGVITAALASGVVYFAFGRKSKAPEPTAPLAVAAPDPVAITVTETSKSREESSRIEANAQQELASESVAIPATGKKRTEKPSAVPNSAGASSVPTPVAFTLAINSNPDGAAVQIDGQSHSEKTPFSVTGLESGLHTLTFTKPGFLPLTRTFELAAGTNANVTVTLTAASTAAEIESTPAGAAIYVDDEPTGQTTPATLKLTTGMHSVAVAKEGYEEGNGSVNVVDGETQHFSTVLQPADREVRTRRFFGGAKDKAMVIVRSRPRGARVTVGGAPAGMPTPAHVPVHSGKVQILVEKDGFAPFRRDLQIEKGEVLTLDAILERQTQ